MVIPIVLFIVFIMLLLLIATYRVSRTVLEDYHNFTISGHSREVRKILDAAVTEVATVRDLPKEVVVEAGKKAVIDEVSSYWSKNDLDGVIAATDGGIVYSSVEKDLAESLLSRIPSQGVYHMDRGLRHMRVSATTLSAWDWRILTVSQPAALALFKNEVALLLPLMAAGLILVLVGVFAVLRKNVHQPVEKMISEIRNEREIGETGIYELDTVGTAINDAFRRLKKKTEQYQTLHGIAVFLHEDRSSDELLNRIIERVGRLIDAEIAALALYDERGKFKKLLSSGVTSIPNKGLPEGKGLLELLRLSLTPVRIDDVPGHHAFSGSFPEGHPVVRNLLGYPIFSDDGRPMGALYFGNKPGGFTDDDEAVLKAVSADVGIALNRAERLMQLKRFKQVIDSAFDVIVITDVNGYITYANYAFEAVTGFSREEALGRRADIVKSGYHDEDFYRDLWNAIKAGDVWKGELINKKKNGEIYHASTAIFPIYHEGEISYVSIQRDITEEKKLYEQLLRAQKMEAIGTLAGGIAHDFNNLLAAIQGYSELLMEMTKEGDQFRKAVNIIQNAAERGADLAKKILMVTRKEKMEAKPVNINDVIENSMELLQRSIPKNIEMITNLGKAIPKVKADPSQIQQVIMNLAVNARDAMPEGGKLTIETAVVGAESGAPNGIPAGRGEFVKLSISDTGTGMDKETQRKVFDPFFTTKESGKGTGLGLYIVHSIVVNHGGYINLYSEPLRGTRFNIYLHRAEEAEDEEAGVEEDARGSGKILVIDDEPNVRELCKDMLEPLGYTVLLGESGEAGIRVFREFKDEIAAVILDLIMPQMSGSEAFQVLKTIRPDATILLCSGYSQKGFAGIDSLMKGGAKGFIQKPFTRLALAGAIKKALRPERE